MSFEELYPFEKNFHQLGDLKMHYLDEGKGEAVVMVHGNPTWSFYYREVVKSLSATNRCIVPDHIGCGFSDKPQDYNYTLQSHIDNLESLLEKVLDKDEKVNLIVHDWGGAIGFGWAIKYPERVKRITILNTSAFLSTRIPARINICRLPGFGALAIRGFNAFAGAATTMAVTKPLSDDVKAGYVKPYDSWENRIATLRFVQDIPMHENIPSYAVVKNIQENLWKLALKPILIQWGGRDWCFTKHFYEEFLRYFPDAQAHCYEDAGHYILEDAKDEVIGKIKDFLCK